MILLKILLIVTLCAIAFFAGKIHAIMTLYHKVYGGKGYLPSVITAYDSYMDIMADYARLGHNIIDDDLK